MTARKVSNTVLVNLLLGLAARNRGSIRPTFGASTISSCPGTKRLARTLHGAARATRLAHGSRKGSCIDLRPRFCGKAERKLTYCRRVTPHSHGACLALERDAALFPRQRQRKKGPSQPLRVLLLRSSGHHCRCSRGPADEKTILRNQRSALSMNSISKSPDLLTKLWVSFYQLLAAPPAQHLMVRRQATVLSQAGRNYFQASGERHGRFLLV